MKYYSDVTKLFYDSAEKCQADEKRLLEARAKDEAEAKAKAEKRAARAKDVEAAYQMMQEAAANYNKLVAEFIKDYGSFHMTWSNTNNADDLGMNNLARSLFKFF